MVPEATQEKFQEEIAALLRELESMIDKLDIPFGGKLKDEIGELRRYMAEQRPPRLALVGRRGAGKSSLINALFGEYVADVGHEGAMTGEATWWSYQGRLGAIEVLDTRGLQEGSDPEKADRAATAKESIISALSEKRADAIIFLVKATEVDAAIDRDIEALAEISDWVEQTYGHRPAVVAVATHCDVLEPKKVELHNPDDFPPEDVAEKRRRVRDITADLKQKITAVERLEPQLIDAIGISAYMSWRDDGTLRADDRWHVDRLAEYLIDELPNQAKFQMARLAQVTFLQSKVAMRIVHATATICGGIAATPIPIADVAPITSAQAAMIVGIGYLSGRDLDMKGAAEFIGAMGVNAGAAYGLRHLARALAKLVPVAGSAVSAAVAYGGTYALGRAAVAYFIGDADKQAAREVFEEVKDEAVEEYEADSVADSDDT